MKNTVKNKKNVFANINWEKVGVYIAIGTLIIIFAQKVNELSERISKIEGKLEILIRE